MIEEEKRLKESLEKMKAAGKQIKGYDLASGRLRDVIASMLHMSKTKVAQIESVNNNLIPEFYQMVPDGAYNHGAYELRPGAFRVTCADGLFRVSLTVQQAGGGLSRTVEFTVRCLNYKPTT